MIRKAIFLDRDGVLNKAIVRNGKAFSPRSREEFIIDNNASMAVELLHNAGFKVFVVTNQPDIARGKLKRVDLEWMTAALVNRTRVDDVFICMHDDHHNCMCRKPAPGMLIDCSQKWRVDLSESYIVGDSWKDMEAGKNAGCKSILIDTEYNKGVIADWHVNSLVDAAKIILGGG